MFLSYIVDFLIHSSDKLGTGMWDHEETCQPLKWTLLRNRRTTQTEAGLTEKWQYIGKEMKKEKSRYELQNERWIDSLDFHYKHTGGLFWKSLDN